MIINLQRYSDNGDSTFGLLFSDKTFECYTIEDEFRKEKIKGETRIDAGLYELKIRKADTPLTLKHRKSYGDWFEYHIEIVGLPRHSYVYIHAGNKESHTDACLLLGDTANNNKVDKGFLGSSVKALKRFYEKYYPILEKEEEKVFINIMDEDKIQYYED